MSIVAVSWTYLRERSRCWNMRLMKPVEWGIIILGPSICSWDWCGTVKALRWMYCASLG